MIARKHKLFVEKGEDAIAEIQKIHKRHRELLKESENEFPLSSAQAADLRTNLRDHILKISGAEKQAVDLMQNAIV